MDDAFWLRYLCAHADPRTRNLHAAGTILASLVGTVALAVHFGSARQPDQHQQSRQHRQRSTDQ